MHTDKVGTRLPYIEFSSSRFSPAYRKELEKEVKNRVGGTDFKRMLISALQVSIYGMKSPVLDQDPLPIKANRDELNPSQIQQARQMGIESIIDR